MILDIIKLGVGLIGGIFKDKAEGKISEQQATQALAEIQAKLVTDVEATYRKEIEAKERVLVAELQQGDNFTKRARPTVVYFGLLVLLLNHVVLPWVAHFAGQAIPAINIPTEFWLGWSGIVATWVIGRTAEKRGSANKVVGLITGR
jgi:hypothetical protein